MKMLKVFLMLSVFLLLQWTAYSQKKDSTVLKHDSATVKSPANDSLAKKAAALNALKKKNDPGKASLYSAIFPGLGQIHNKKYWKAPIVWAAVGIPTYTFFFNRSWYNKSRYALAVLVNGSQLNADSLKKVDPSFLAAVKEGTADDATQLQNIRNFYRQNEDYSVLFFLLFYALQIVDATVDAHLKDFNVNSDLSFRIRPGIIEGSNFGGLTLAFDLHKPRSRPLITLP